ncbi:MAG: hypothetical protein AAFU77_01940 [Myxococcota bacterium]
MLRLIRSTDYGALLDLVSPRFFEVLPARALRSEVGALIKGYRDTGTFRNVTEDLRHSMSVELAVDVVDRVRSRTVEDPTAYGQRLLELYFWQLFARETVLLDLRSSRVRFEQGRLKWKPSRIYARWDLSFLEPLRQLYAGFYDDDRASFDSALKTLDLTEAAPLFIEHFGGGDQRAVRFELDAFQSVFQRVFTTTRDAGKQLHPSFISLGVYLGALYENLSRFDRGFDVRDAFVKGRGYASELKSKRIG